MAFSIHQTIQPSTHPAAHPKTPAPKIIENPKAAGQFMLPHREEQVMGISVRYFQFEERGKNIGIDIFSFKI